MQDLEKIISKFEEIVSQNYCDNLAKRVGFIQRSSSRLKGHEFAQAMMIPNAFIEAETLNSLAKRMQRINKECNVTASALFQRMNKKSAEAFMKACFGKVLREVVQTELNNLPDLKNLECFNRVLIEDSTMVELNEKLSPFFKGRGGAASKSALKINYIFDYLKEQIIDIEFFSGNIPDQKLASGIVSKIEKGDLVIRDLGYYALKRIIEIQEAWAYYISRLKSNVDVYESETSPEPLDLAAFLDLHNNKGLVEKEVYLGKNRQKVRLVACEMAEEIINKRRRVANRTAQRCGRQTTKKKLNLLKYNIFITNVSAEILSIDSVMSTYRARRRIELIFKQWKSCLKIHYFKGYKPERIHCLLYGRMIMILLLGSITPILMKYALTKGRELSSFKLINYLIADHSFAMAFKENMSGFIDQLFEDIPRRLCQDKRSRPSLRSDVRYSRSYYKPIENNELDKKTA